MKIEEKKSITEKVDYANALEKQKHENQRKLLKDVQMNDLDNYYRKKSVNYLIMLDG